MVESCSRGRVDAMSLQYGVWEEKKIHRVPQFHPVILQGQITSGISVPSGHLAKKSPLRLVKPSQYS
jgi:hypothetical protein